MLKFAAKRLTLRISISAKMSLSLSLVDAELVLPTIRSAVEKQLNLIAQGKANFQQVLQHTLDIFKRKFHYFVDSITSKSTGLWSAASQNPSGGASYRESFYVSNKNTCPVDRIKPCVDSSY